MVLFHADAGVHVAQLRRIFYPFLLVLVHQQPTAIMLPGAHHEDESEALRATVTVHYGLEDEKKTTRRPKKLSPPELRGLSLVGDSLRPLCDPPTPDRRTSLAW